MKLLGTWEELYQPILFIHVGCLGISNRTAFILEGSCCPVWVLQPILATLVDITKQPHCKKEGCCANKCRFTISCGLDQSQYSHWALLMSNQNSCNTETGQHSPCTSAFVVVHPLLEQMNRVAKNEHLVHCTSLKLIKKGLQRWCQLFCMSGKVHNTKLVMSFWFTWREWVGG